MNKHKQKEFNCSICLENIEEYDCTKTNCGHLFHPNVFGNGVKLAINVQIVEQI